MNVIRLVTALVSLFRFARHIRKARHVSLQGNLPFRHLKHKGNAPNCPHPVAAIARRIVETGRAHPVLLQSLQVEVGGDHLLAIRKSLRFRQQFIVLVDQRMAIPGEVRRALARPSGRVEIRRDAFAGL